jgi:hypothetical protein
VRTPTTYVWGALAERYVWGCLAERGGRAGGDKTDEVFERDALELAWLTRSGGGHWNEHCCWWAGTRRCLGLDGCTAYGLAVCKVTRAYAYGGRQPRAHFSQTETPQPEPRTSAGIPAHALRKTSRARVMYVFTSAQAARPSFEQLLPEP